MLVPIDLIIVWLWSIIGLAVTASVVAFDRAADLGGLLAVLRSDASIKVSPRSKADAETSL
jgi:hypothetical protein